MVLIDLYVKLFPLLNDSSLTLLTKARESQIDNLRIKRCQAEHCFSSIVV